MILIVKCKPTADDARLGMDYRQRDLAFVKRHLAEGWPETLVVTEIDPAEIVASIIQGKASLDTIIDLLE